MLVKGVSIRIYFDLPNNQNLIYQLTKKTQHYEENLLYSRCRALCR